MIAASALPSRTTKIHQVDLKESVIKNSADRIESPPNNNTEEDDEDDDMLEEQLEEYREMLDELGNHADKVSINTLSMVAEDHADSKNAAKALHDCIRSLLISSSVAYDRKLPLIYVLDSILKNVGKEFIPLVEADAPNWIPGVHAAFVKSAPALNLKLRKVLNTWKDFAVFKPDAVQRMIQSFQEADAVSMVEKVTKSSNSLENISPQLKISMQSVLDDIHSDVDELDKVSLERLAIINPALLGEIKKAALEMMQNGGKNGAGAGSNNDNSQSNNFTGGTNFTSNNNSSNDNNSNTMYPNKSSLFSNRIPDGYAKRSQDWMNVGFSKSQSRDLVSCLQQSVRTGSAALVSGDVSSSSSVSPQSNTNIGLIAAASSTANHISLMLQLLQSLDEKIVDVDQPFRLPMMGDANNSSLLTDNNIHLRHGRSSNPGNNNKQQQIISKVNKSLFTTAGLMKMKHLGIVGSLYDQGLPFVSISDGRRFATQIELSKHFDAFFRKSQLEKTMERTEERGWHILTSRWSRTESEVTTSDMDQLSSADATVGDDQNNTFATTQSSSVPADEARSRCAICGNPFEMYFDQEEGDHMYSNCREIEVLNDDAAEKESEAMLVHIRCLQGLGSPDVLTVDQVLQS